MMNNYHFLSRWQVQASCEEVYRLLEVVEDLPRWWPSVYLEVSVLEKGLPGGVGKQVALYTKGWLPYTLRWQFRVTDTNFPHGFSLEAYGDFDGQGIWTFRQMPDGKCEILYDWQIRAEKALLKLLTPLLRPLFSANHQWAMRMGERSLQLELQRRRAQSAEELSTIPAPPPPTFPHNLYYGRS